MKNADALPWVTSLRILSHGAFGLTYRASTRAGGAIVLKELFPLGAERLANGTVAFAKYDRERLLREFRSEAITLHALSLQEVPNLLWNAEANGTQYLAMEYIEGQVLSEWFDQLFRRDALKAAAALTNCFRSLLTLLGKLETLGIVHGDIAARNIVMDTNGCPRLIDFGASRHILDRVSLAVVGDLGGRVPDVVLSQRQVDHWLDVHALCATFYCLLAGTPPFQEDGKPAPPLHTFDPATHLALRMIDRKVVAAIERGLVRTGHEPVVSAAALLASLAGDLEPPHPEASTRARELRKMTNPAFERYQRCLLQSFDTARFRYDDRQWLKRADGQPLETSKDQKIALARTEALLNICFGREIVVPAGQIADSPAFEKVFSEINAAYAPRRDRIREACAGVGIPEWRPFRVGLAQERYKDYVGFTGAYEYTGADLVALELKGEEAEREKQTEKLLTKAAELFSKEEFANLGAMIHQATGREGFEYFARSVHGYFDASASVFANPNEPDVSAGAYGALFDARLKDQAQAQRGSELALEMKEPKDLVLSRLQTSNVQGLRGNWYVYRREFGQNWQLARAYLDFRLFMNLSRIYTIDHPILVSQVFEYGRYDHCLFLGPKFVQQPEGELARDVQLLRLVGQIGDCIDWDGVMELFVDDHFLRNIALLTQHYFYDGDAGFYQNILGAHGSYLSRHAGSFIDIDLRKGSVTPAAPPRDTEDTNETPHRTVFVEAVDASLRADTHEYNDAATYRSVMNGLDAGNGYAMVAIAPLDANGLFNLGAEMADQMLNYYVKPYRLMANRRL